MDKDLILQDSLGYITIVLVAAAVKIISGNFVYGLIGLIVAALIAYLRILTKEKRLAKLVSTIKAKTTV